MPPTHQISRGELLRWMRHKTQEEKRLSAPLLGYEWRESQSGNTFQPEAVERSPLLGEMPQPKEKVTSTPSAQRPPERFYALSQRERYANSDDQNDGLPASLRGVAPLLDDDLKPFAEGDPLPYQPLLSEQRLLPFLRHALLYPLGQKLDIPQLVKRVARLETLRSLPYQPHTVPAGRVYVLLDVSKRLRPFWEDAHAACSLIERKHGRNGLDIRVVEDDPQGHYWDWFDGQQPLQAWGRLKPQSVVLILSDMGQLRAEGSVVRQHWLRLAKQLQRQGVKPVVLSPISPQHQCSQLQSLTHQVLWGRHSRLKPQKRNSRMAEHSAYVQRVLGLLSVAAHVEPELLRAVLACLPAYQADAGVEADVYQHADMQWGHNAISLRPEKRSVWQAQFKAEPAAVQRQVLALLQQHHIGQFPAVWADEVLNAQKLVAPELGTLAYLLEAEQFMMRFASGFAQQSGHEGMAQFARRHLQRLGKDDQGKTLYRESYANGLYGLAYHEQLRNGKEVSAAYDAEVVLSVVRQRVERRRYRLIQCGEYLEIFTAEQERDGFAAGVSLAEFEAVHDALLVKTRKTLPPQPPLPEVEGEQEETNTVVSFGRRVRVLHLQGQTVTLNTGLEKLVVMPLTKPTWARAIWRDVDGVVATIPWLGSDWDVRWQLPTVLQDSYWVWQPPFGEDQYGLYADLEIKGITQRFRWIEPGTFLMGSPESEADREPWTKGSETQHQVTLTQGFWLADTTVTQAQWQVVMGNNPSRFKDDPNNPVEQVSWNGIQDFINKLNTLIPGLQAKLPTEAQWEYACRAGTTTPFSFGDNVTPEQVNYDGNHPYAGGKKGLYREKTVPVKSLPANPWGLYEMHGNVYEWCQDAWQEKLSASPITDPEGVAGGDQAGVVRVLRGGSWHGDGRFVRSAYRNRLEPVDRSNALGFRLALGHASAGQAQGGGAAKQAKADGSDAGRRGSIGGDTAGRGSAGSDIDKPTVAERVVEGFKGLTNLFRKKK